MIDLTNIPDDVLVARGQYSTVNSAHKDTMRKMAELSSDMMTLTGQMLRKVQDTNYTPDSTLPQTIIDARYTLTEMENTVIEIESLTKQKLALREKAWPK